MAGEIGDGWLGMHLSPAGVAKWKGFLAEGLARRTDKVEFAIWALVRVHTTDDVKEALQALKPRVALAIGGLGARDKNFHADMMASNGFSDAASRIQELYLSGRTEEAAAAVPDEYLDEEALVGPPARLKERLARWRDAGVTGVTLQHPTLPAIEALAEFAGD
jgi:alkanesulfonate monooxygenase SsuD/methylene tetrahydromethanopterin reductase-like flavin-dependent oxidoreductase (luciferase family)